MPDRNILQYVINSGFVRVVTSAGIEIPAFWAHPTTGGPFPGLVLLHDDWGLEAATRAMAHRFAEAGYYVMAPDLFEGQHASNQIEADVLQSRYKPLAPPKVIAALVALETHPKCNRKMAVIGWDLGGELVVQLALERRDVMAAIAISSDPALHLVERGEQLQCPFLTIWGAQDEVVQRTIHVLQAELSKSSKPHEVMVYPKAAHGFYNYFTPAYNAEVAEEAWNKMLTFLELHQGKPPAPDDATPGQFRPGRVY